ncbi:MAG TPA: 3-ketoacyl-ACP reductase FabG2 [Gammaproteobacteria bacterium]|nr:3-ketoacyl-ACP reductase FabG2 [Gammaproteobacteria bacterium]
MRRVLVTGASKGIGQATALMLAKNKFHVIVHYHSDRLGAENTLAAIIADKGSAEIIQFDIGDRQQCDKVIRGSIEKHGAFYGIVNNAGICDDVVFPSMEAESWDKVVHTNLDSFYNVIKPCVMPMIQARVGGRIVTLSSVSGMVGNRGQVNYSAAKAGIIGATKALALELAKRKITVNCVAPGLIDTDMIAKTQTPLAEIIKLIPVKRIGQAREVASLINYLMSDDAAYITRQVIGINGGLI